MTKPVISFGSQGRGPRHREAAEGDPRRAPAVIHYDLRRVAGVRSLSELRRLLGGTEDGSQDTPPPEPIKDWSLTSLKEKLIKIGAKVVSHGRYIIFQMTEVAIARQRFQEILRLIAELRPQPPPAPA
jgi:hypothetical protein